MTPDTMNEFGVGTQGGEVVVMVRVPHLLSREQSLRLAAWLAAVADPGGEDFAGVLAAVRST